MTDKWRDIPGLKIHTVHDEETLEWMRRVRNATLGPYSHDNEPVSVEAQAAWWADGQANESLKAFVWTAGVGGEGDDIPVSYGFFKIIAPRVNEHPFAFDGLPVRSEETAACTIGVAPDWQRRGLGFAIMATIEHVWMGPIVAMSRIDNPGGSAMHRASAGWREVRRDATYVYWRREGR